MMKKYLLFVCCCLAAQWACGQLRGRVVSAAGRPLSGATVALGEAFVTAADSSGGFVIPAPAGRYMLRVRFVGYAAVARQVLLPADTVLVVMDVAGALGLSEVTVSTGYQELPRERATGSFVQVDRQLLERPVTTGVLERLRDVVPGLRFNSLGTRLSVRGQSTLFSNAAPLIVVDGFAYEQPIENLNPNEVESVTVLRDAAAASIWGARAGNGVIVVTTKKGGYDRPMRVVFNGSVTAGERPDLYSVARMSPADYLGIEKQLFSEGYYDAVEAGGRAPLSPAVALLLAGRPGEVDALGANDLRGDLEKYFYRPALKQQYALSLDGGAAASRYFFSAGVDRNLEERAGNGYDRLTLSAKNSWRWFSGRLGLETGLNYTRAGQDRNAPGDPLWKYGYPLYPYADLADASGRPLAVTRDLRDSFVAGAPALGLLDWTYRPLQELRLGDNRTVSEELRLNTGLNGRLLPGLSARLLYQYDRSGSALRDAYDPESFFARDLVNRYSQDDGSGGIFRALPLGGVVDLENGVTVHQDLRGQLDYERVFGGRHALTAIAGAEAASQHSLSDSYRLYGYDPVHGTSVAVNGAAEYTFYDTYDSGTIPMNLSESDLTDHYRSFYANAAYTYDGRLSLSGSARLDQSNLFGVRSNQKGVPLWSVGAAWNLSREGFYHLDWLPELKLRATYGYSGNSNKNLSAYTTAAYNDGAYSQTRLPFARIVNPPNPALRWERIGNLNLGLDFAALGGRLSGSLEWFAKRGSDLIGNTTYPPSSGVTVFTGNTAGTLSHGLDLSLHAVNLAGRLGWQSDFFVSTIYEKVTAYDEVSDISVYLAQGNYGFYPLPGRPLFAVYSYQWAGLDPATGDPQGRLQGQLSKDYAAIISGTTPQNVTYNGPSRPTVFGALRNSFSYGPFSLSLNISYALGYYFRRSALRYNDDHGLSQQSGDYALRWQQPGDEAHTSVPSAPAAPDLARDNFYAYSSALVEKGDHIRLADARFSWMLKKRGLELYAYGANLGILWRANRYHLDPDQPAGYRLPRTLALGVRFTY
jgi:TonB-linked SusC/RagA family outer membrane protein